MDHSEGGRSRSHGALENDAIEIEVAESFQVTAHSEDWKKWTMGFDVAEDLESIHFRHKDVGYDQVRFIEIDMSDRGVGLAENDGAVSRSIEQDGKAFSMIGIVIDDDDSK